MKTVKEFYDAFSEALDETEILSDTHDLASRLKADHICYKCSSSESFERIRKMFEDSGHTIYQSPISGRRIALIKTLQTVVTPLGDVRLIELSDQKPDGSQTEGPDHIEAYPIDVSYDDNISYLEERGLEVKKISRPHHTTHDIKMDSGFIFRLTQEPLAQKVGKEWLQ